MTDEEFLTAFEDCTLAEFHHADHIRVAWLYLGRYGYETGSLKIKNGIQRFAAAKKANTLYHETITMFWIRLVQHVMRANPKAESFVEFIHLFPPLGDSKSIYRHYTKEYLMSEIARKVWCDPDILGMPEEKTQI